MKSFDRILQERRSVRKYLDTPVEQEKILALLEAARIAPSACNAQPWRFCVVTEPALRDRVVAGGLGGMAVPNAWAKTAPALIVACSERNFLTHALAARIKGIQYHLMDLGIAMEHLVLKAAELDLGTCYIGWFKGKAIHRLLRLPFSWRVECLITLGYPAEIPDASPRKPLQEVCLFNGK